MVRGNMPRTIEFYPGPSTNLPHSYLPALLIKLRGLALAIEPIDDEQIAPVGMPCKSVGGGDFGVQIGSTAGQKGPTGGAGLNTIGLLVRTWGRTSARNVTERTFCVSDGSGAPVKCKAPADTEFVIPSDDSFVSVTGAVSCETGGPGNLAPLIRIRCQADVR